MKPLWVACVVTLLVQPGVAAAQDVDKFIGALAAGAEGVGQSLGESMRGGDSIFVSATGRAALPGRPAEAYIIDVESKAPSVVEAARLRDQRVQAARAIARRFNMKVETGVSGLSRIGDGSGSLFHLPGQLADDATGRGANDAGDKTTPTSAKPKFAAHTEMRFSAADPGQFPAFLDALDAAGVDIPAGGGSGSGIMALLSQKSAASLGFATVEAADDATWDRASQNALAEARRQATVLAAAAGRPLGEVKQILFFMRTVEGDRASVTLAVRYGFAPPR
jgi:hypothetical protein